MNSSKIKMYFELAAEKALTREDQRTFFLGCVAIRKDGARVVSSNSPSSTPNRTAHCEYKALKKCDRGATLFVARVKADGSYGMSRPCPNCSKAIISKDVEKVYYTINENQYGVWNVNKDSDRSFNMR